MIAGRLLALGSLAVMLAAIAIAWGFEIFGGYAPCPLCLQQRVPYYVAIPLAAIALAMVVRPPVFRTVMIAAGFAMAAGVALGVYHAGAEWAWWEGPNTCGAGGADGGVTDASNLLAAIQDSNFVSCTDVQGRFLGLSFAGWNVVSASVASLAAFAAAAAPRTQA